MNCFIDGWFETEYGMEQVYIKGETLAECVKKAVHMYPEFGHTDMEFEGKDDRFPMRSPMDVTSRVIDLSQNYQHDLS